MSSTPPTQFSDLPETDDGWVPARLYKYRSLSEGVRKYTQSAIVDRSLYFAPASSFNDPFDFAPRVEIEGTRDQLSAFYERAYRAAVPDGSRADRRRAVKQAREMPAAALKQVLREAVAANTDSVGICSFSADGGHILLWSHYATNHEGICLRFTTDRPISMFNLAQRVRYSAERPVLNRVAEPGPEAVLRTLCTKADFWSYEKEWRGLNVHQGPGAYTYDARCLQAVILGAKISASNRAMVLEWVTGSGVEVLQAELDHDHYRLHTRSLGIR